MMKTKGYRESFLQKGCQNEKLEYSGRDFGI